MSRDTMLMLQMTDISKTKRFTRLSYLEQLMFSVRRLQQVLMYQPMENKLVNTISFIIYVIWTGWTLRDFRGEKYVVLRSGVRKYQQFLER